MSGARPHTLRRWLQPLFGVAILGLVMWFLPWQDVVELKAPVGEEAIALECELTGDWKGAATDFDVAP